MGQNISTRKCATAEDRTIMRNDLEENQRRMNILIYGPQGVGKTTFINTIYRVLTGRTQTSLSEAGIQGARTTFMYRPITFLSNRKITLMDSPGLNYIDAINLKALEAFLKGIKAGFKHEWINDNSPPSLKSQFVQKLDEEDSIDLKNAIDFGIVVLDATKLEICDQNRVYRAHLPTSSNIEASVTKVVEVTNYRPILVITHEDKMNLKKIDIINLFNSYIPPENIIFISNYTCSGVEKREATDDTVLRLLSTILERIKNHA